MSRPFKKHRGVYEHPKKSNVWWILYYDQFGRRHREKVGPRQKAISAYQKRKTDIRLGKFIPQDIRVRQASVEEIINDRIEVSKLLRSRRTEKQRFEWWQNRFKNRAARSIIPGDIEQARLELAKQHTVATCNRYLASLKAAYSLAMKNEKVERNPVKEVRLQKENNKRVRWLTIEEEARLFGSLPIQWHPLVLVALDTGLRRGEPLSLLWEDVNFQQRFITARQTKAGDTRQVPMNDVVVEALRKIPRRLDNEYVFPGRIKGFHLTDLPKEWETCVKNAQLEDFRWHDLRHTFASRLVMAGVDLYTVKKLLGHHDLTMTERYAHLAPHYLKKADSLALSSAQQPSEQPLATFRCKNRLLRKLLFRDVLPGFDVPS
jgi:integrase